jgi:predicted acyltransferase
MGAVPLSSRRLVSLDALRGFDMFWIAGIEGLVSAWHRVCPDSRVVALAAEQLEHVEWVGFHFLDLVFPLFVFMAGVSLPFSLSKALEQGGRSAAVRRILGRTLLLVLLGIFSYGGLTKGPEGIRLLGVLQRIGLASGAAGLAYLFLSQKGRIGLTVTLLLGYWGLMMFVPVPGSGETGVLSGPTHNWAHWVDAHYLPLFKWKGTHDPEGLLSTWPAIATALLGLFAGDYLRLTSNHHQPARQALHLLGAGVVLAIAGWLWHLHFPVIKNLWTSSFVLVAAGYSAALLAVFHWLIEARGWRAWAVPFVWIGLNPIAVFLLRGIVDLGKLAQRLTGGTEWLQSSWGGWAAVWTQAVIVGLLFFFAWWLHQRKIYFRA